MRILDTDVCVEILRGNHDVALARARVRDDVATTWISASELYYGAARSASPDENALLVSSFIDSLPILGPDRASARIFGEARALLERAGRRPPDADLHIASIAIALGAILVTWNRRHFYSIPGIVIEEWVR